MIKAHPCRCHLTTLPLMLTNFSRSLVSDHAARSRLVAMKRTRGAKLAGMPFDLSYRPPQFLHDPAWWAELAQYRRTSSGGRPTGRETRYPVWCCKPWLRDNGVM